MATELGRRIGALQRSAPGIAPAAAFMAVALWWAADDGGFDPLVWLPGSIILVALTVVLVTVGPRHFTGGRLLLGATGLLLAFTFWCFLSILWSETPDAAWSGANLTAVYLAIFVLFTWCPWPAPVAAALLGGFSFATSVVGLVALLRATGSSTPTDYFIAGRLAAPIVYSNANTALLVSVAFPALFLASRKEVHWVFRGILLASVGVLAELALMCQSRAIVVVLPVTMLIFLAIAPGRTRIAIYLAAVVGVVGVVGSRPVLQVYEAVVSGEDVSSALSAARTAVLVTGAALFVIGSSLALLDRRVILPRRGALGISVAMVVVALAVGGAGSAMLVNRYQPQENAAVWWQRFKGGSYLYEPGTPHLVSGLGSGRYDIWRVSFDLFKSKPWRGAGIDTFGAEYLRHRTRLQDPLYSHSIELRTLSGTGLVGTSLLLGFFLTWSMVAARRLRRGSQFSRGVVASAVAVVVYWVTHGSVDWLWEMPVLGAFAFACMGLACTTGAGGAEPRVPEETRAPAETDAADGTRRVPYLIPVAAIVLGLLVATSMAIPWLANREIDAAASGWPTNPQGAFDELARARRYNPLSDQPDIYAGVIAGQIGDEKRQRSALEGAIARNSTNWYPYLALGALRARNGARSAGLVDLERARLLNPLEPVILEVERRVRAGKPPSNSEIDRMLVERVDLLTGRSQG